MSIPCLISVLAGKTAAAVECRSLAEMERTLDQLHAEAAEPICVAVVLEGYEVDVGLGADPTFVMIQVEPCDGEYYPTSGDPQAEGSVGFGGCGDWTPFERHTFVTYSLAGEAVTTFVAEQSLSGEIQWRDWDQRLVTRIGNEDAASNT